MELEDSYFRTFIGVPIEVGKHFLESRNILIRRLSGERISWVRPELYHVTLRFLGDTPADDIPNIGNALSEMDTQPETYMTLNEMSSFGPRKRPRVVWVGLEKEEIVSQWKNSVDRVLRSCGHRFEKEPFRAHLTLGRIRSLKNPDRFYEILEEMKQQFRESILIDRIVFYRSIMKKNGPEYRVLKEIMLRSSEYG